MGVLPEDRTREGLDEEVTCVGSQVEAIRVHVAVSDESRAKAGFPSIGHIPCGLVVAGDILLTV